MKRLYKLVSLCGMALLAMSVLMESVSAYQFGQDVVVANSAGDEHLDAFAFDCNQAQYLVVWQVDSGGGDTDLWARRARGWPFQWQGQGFPIAATSSPERAAAVAFDPDPNNGGYLVAYEVQLGSDIDVMGQRVATNSGQGDNGPELKGGAFPIANQVSQERQPDVAFLPSTGQFLVAYVFGDDIWGQRVGRYHAGDGGGETVSADFPIADDGRWAERQPAIVASTQQSYFMVAYTYEFAPGDFDVRGQRVSGFVLNGDQRLSTPFEIAASGASELQPALAYSQNRQAILAVWNMSAGGKHGCHGRLAGRAGVAGRPAYWRQLRGER